MTFLSTNSGKITRNRRRSHIALDDSTDVLNDSFQIVFIFNQRITTLQCLVGFPHTTTQISHKDIIHSLVSLPPTSRYPTL